MMRNISKDFINFGCVKVYKKQNERRFAVSLYKAFTVISSDLLSALAVLFLSPSLPDNSFFRVNSHDTQKYLIDENTSCYEAIWIPIFIHRCVKWRCHLKFIITDNATILQDTNINYRRYIDSLSRCVYGWNWMHYRFCHSQWWYAFGLIYIDVNISCGMNKLCPNIMKTLTKSNSVWQSLTDS